MSLFDQQNGSESDFLDGPGFTGADLHPSTFAGLSPMTALKGIGAGAEEGLGILTGGLPTLAHTALTGAQLPGGMGEAIANRITGLDPLAQAAEATSKELEKPWMPQVQAGAEAVDMAARAQAKKLMPDPAVSGSGTNLIFGFAKGATQAVGALLTREPLLAAPLFGYMQGMGNYRDLRDQGVDDPTAQRAATLNGMLAGASFLAPAGLPAKWLSEMAPATQAVTQLATGASINAAQGMGSRYLTSKLLDDAGYHDLAAQNKTLDGQAMLADILSGAFFGGAHFFNGHAQALADTARKAAESGALDPAIRDAAKVAQDARMAAIDRAPGIPLDGESAGVHRMALEKAMGDLLADKSVDVDDLFDEHAAAFLRNPQDEAITTSSRELIHQEFMDAGVMAESSKVDALDKRLSALYQEPPVKPYTKPVMIPQDEGAPLPSGVALAKDKETAANDETPALLKAAADCVGRTA